MILQKRQSVKIGVTNHDRVLGMPLGAKRRPQAHHSGGPGQVEINPRDGAAP